MWNLQILSDWTEEESHREVISILCNCTAVANQHVEFKQSRGTVGMDNKWQTCGILKGICGLWKPTAKKKGSSSLTRLFSNLTASSVLSRSGRVPPGCSLTFTAQSKLTWSFPSFPLHIWKQRLYENYVTSEVVLWPQRLQNRLAYVPMSLGSAVL